MIKNFKENEWNQSARKSCLLFRTVCSFKYLHARKKSKKFLWWKKGPALTKWLFVLSVILNGIALSQSSFIVAIFQGLIRMKAAMLLSFLCIQQ